MTTYDIETQAFDVLHAIGEIAGILAKDGRLPDDARKWLGVCRDNAKLALGLERVHTIRYYWRGDNEDTTVRSFSTEDEAWAFVKGKIRKFIKAFEPEEKTHAKTVVDFDAVRKELFSKGYARVEFCQCSAWWYNFMYDKQKPRPHVDKLPPWEEAFPPEEEENQKKGND